VARISGIPPGNFEATVSGSTASKKFPGNTIFFPDYRVAETRGSVRNDNNQGLIPRTSGRYYSGKRPCTEQVTRLKETESEGLEATGG